MIYIILKHILILFKIDVSFMLDGNLQTVSFSMLGHFTVGNYVLWCYSVRQRSYKQNVFIFRISFVVESFITIHRVLGHTIKNVIGIAIYNLLFKK
jgi:hypothetical protein